MSEKSILCSVIRCLNARPNDNANLVSAKTAANFEGYTKGF